MLQIKNTLGGGKPEGLYVWKKHEIGSELKELNKSVSTLPYSFFDGCAVVLNGEIHILGSNESSCYTKHYKWNGTSWVSVSTLPYNFRFGSAVVLDGEIHILGSADTTSTFKYHYKWNGSSWVSVSTLPCYFYYGSAVVLNGEIHILGCQEQSFRKIHYKWDGASWAEVSTLPYSFYGGSAVMLNGEIHILGGADSIKKHYKWDGTNWTSVSTLPYEFCFGTAVVLNGEIHIFGSGYSTSYYKYHYKWDGTSWTSVSTLPYDFYQGSAVVLNGGIHILGSSDSSYCTAHYLIIGYAPTYTFIDYIVSDKETAYPDGGEKGGYWYEKVSEGITPEMLGCSKMAVDTYTPTANTQLGTVTLNHSLGEIPRLVIITSNNMESYIAGIYTTTIKLSFISNWHGTTLTQFSCGALKNSDNARIDYSANNSNITLSSNTLKCSIDYVPGTLYLYAGDTYTIYTFA